MRPVAYPSWDSACRIPRRRSVDWFTALVWLVLIPVSGVAGWYGVWRLIRLLVGHL